MTDLLPLVQEFRREKLESLLRHLAHARLVGQYDANNTYQYIVNRDETQLSWLGDAIAELGGAVDEGAKTGPAPSGNGPSGPGAIVEEDARAARAFVERWRARVEGVANARHRGMLRVVLGETLEQARSFEQVLAGRTDMLGRRHEQLGPAHGKVLASRWIE